MNAPNVSWPQVVLVLGALATAAFLAFNGHAELAAAILGPGMLAAWFMSPPRPPTGGATMALLCLALTLVGCLPSKQSDAEKARAALYGMELLACVHDADTREEARACRAGVDCKYGQGPCP